MLFAVPPVAVVAGLVADAPAAAGLGLGAWAIMAVTYVPMLGVYRLGLWRAPTLPVLALAYIAMTLDSARRHRAGRGGVWKGRPPPSRRR